MLLQGDNKAPIPHTMDVDVLTCAGGHLSLRAAGLVTNLNPPQLPIFPAWRMRLSLFFF